MTVYVTIVLALAILISTWVMHSKRKVKRGLSYRISSASGNNTEMVPAWVEGFFPFDLVIKGIDVDDQILNKLIHAFYETEKTGDIRKTVKAFSTILDNQDWSWPWLDNDPETIKTELIGPPYNWRSTFYFLKVRDIKWVLEQNKIVLPKSIKNKEQREPYLIENVDWETVRNTILEVYDELYRSGENARRIELLCITLMGAYYKGKKLKRIANLIDIRPLTTMSTVFDARTPAVCAKMNGTTLPLSNEWWKVHHPPHVPGCRCMLSTVNPWREKIAETVKDNLYLPEYGVHQASIKNS